MNDVYILEFFTGQSNTLAYSTLEKALDGLQGYATSLNEDIHLKCRKIFPTVWEVESDNDLIENIRITKLEVNPGNPFNVVNDIEML